MEFQIVVANESHFGYAQEICDHMEASAKQRGTGIAKRYPEYICKKMTEGKAVIALKGDEFAGFCYIETWGHGKYVANSGLIVKETMRQSGLAKKIKSSVFELSRQKYPEAKIFGITTSAAVMKINSELGYKPVPFADLTDDEEFWAGCKSCSNHDILQRTQRKYCLCTGMLYDPVKEKNTVDADKTDRKVAIHARWMQMKADMLLEQEATAQAQDGQKTEQKAGFVSPRYDIMPN